MIYSSPLLLTCVGCSRHPRLITHGSHHRPNSHSSVLRLPKRPHISSSPDCCAKPTRPFTSATPRVLCFPGGKYHTPHQKEDAASLPYHPRTWGTCWLSFRHTSGMPGRQRKSKHWTCPLCCNHQSHVHLTPWGLGHFSCS
jgi:hypothetical protein